MNKNNIYQEKVFLEIQTNGFIPKFHKIIAISIKKNNQKIQSYFDKEENLINLINNINSSEIIVYDGAFLKSFLKSRAKNYDINIKLSKIYDLKYKWIKSNSFFKSSGENRHSIIKDAKTDIEILSNEDIKTLIKSNNNKELKKDMEKRILSNIAIYEEYKIRKKELIFQKNNKDILLESISSENIITAYFNTADHIAVFLDKGNLNLKIENGIGELKIEYKKALYENELCYFAEIENIKDEIYDFPKGIIMLKAKGKFIPSSFINIFNFILSI